MDEIVHQKWEKYGRSWNKMSLDEDGRLFQIEDFPDYEIERQKLDLRNKNRGLIRSIVILLDLSGRGMEPREFSVSRLKLITVELEKFIISFFDQNPLSQLAITATYQGRGYVLSPLCGSVSKHLKVVQNLEQNTEYGEPSLQNGLNISASLFSSVARYSTKEIILIYGALNTIDVKIESTIKFLKRSEITVNVIGFGASLYILSRIANETGGKYSIPLNENIFHKLVFDNIEPPILTDKVELRDFVPFCYVKHYDFPSFDINDIKEGKKVPPKSGGYKCGICGFVVFSIPVYCPSCGILLLTPPDITRTQVFLNPPLEFEKENAECVCNACGCIINEKYQCPLCGMNYCESCNTFIHGILRFCPFCSKSK
ncbi:General transcription factor IIH subunit 2 [Histomonas meleagridis]|uniref:General transcription factor IIH subunit 2 n=1 Tax=Histomonas meleagridis TaxID=135588 RepID=UPI00355A843C|nr:General transcription factor IIH subunit 2 [Histomonas meleagridis]KAH0804566.1 General transcription factor IIH subunit 2 [Histomonas meleagridis]